MSFGTFFLPGPTDVRDEVLQAMVRQMIPHRGPVFDAMFATIQQGLQHVFVTERPVYISTSSATGLMEAGTRCAPPGKILSLVNGAFSERFFKIAVACGRSAERYDVPWGDVHDPVMLDTVLHRATYSALTVAHSETSTGTCNDIRAIAEVARRHGVACLVDSVSGAGGAELQVDGWGLDYAFTSSQKALALPPGLAFGVASASFIERARTVPNRGVYFDLVEIDHASRNLGTPAVSLYYALEHQMRDIVREGMPARCARHAAMARQTWQWVEQMRGMLHPDIRVLAPETHRSPTVTVVVVPASITGDQVVAAVAQRGFTIGAGYGALQQTTFRIGHMGDHTEEDLQRCLDVCEAALRDLIARRATSVPR